MSQIKIYDESSKEFVSVASDNAADIVLNSPNYESDNVEGALEEVHTEIEGLKQNVRCRLSILILLLPVRSEMPSNGRLNS